jgi:hypothetical protein
MSRAFVSLAVAAVTTAISAEASAGLLPFTVGSAVGSERPDSAADYSTTSYTMPGYYTYSNPATNGRADTSGLFTGTGFSHFALFNLPTANIYGGSLAQASVASATAAKFNINWSWNNLVNEFATWVVQRADSGEVIASVTIDNGNVTTVGVTSAGASGAFQTTIAVGNYTVTSIMSDRGVVANSVGFASVVWNFEPIPAPGALALLGIAGLVAGRRR